MTYFLEVLKWAEMVDEAAMEEYTKMLGPIEDNGDEIDEYEDGESDEDHELELLQSQEV